MNPRLNELTQFAFTLVTNFKMPYLAKLACECSRCCSLRHLEMAHNGVDLGISEAFDYLFCCKPLFVKNTWFYSRWFGFF